MRQPPTFTRKSEVVDQIGGDGSSNPLEPCPSPEWHLASANIFLVSKFSCTTFEHCTIFILCRGTDFSHTQHRESRCPEYRTWFHLWDQQPKIFVNILLALKSLGLSTFSCYSYVQGTSCSISLKCWDWARVPDIICPLGLCFSSV